MTLDEKMKEAYKNIRAPPGKYALYGWNPMLRDIGENPWRIGEPYEKMSDAINETKKLKDEQFDMNPRIRISMDEIEYFVLDENGFRIY